MFVKKKPTVPTVPTTHFKPCCCTGLFVHKIVNKVVNFEIAHAHTCTHKLFMLIFAWS
jgi:hypothetical protein